MENLYQVKRDCRLCKKDALENVIDFGELALTGVFGENGSQVAKAPLTLAICRNCSMVQLRHTYSLDALYGDTYGYESHLNRSMVQHLQRKAQKLQAKYIRDIHSSVIVDIASNDGTLLAGYTKTDISLVGVDPLIEVVSDFYPEKTTKIADFFTLETYRRRVDRNANLVTSCSVIYDLDDPVQFAQDVFDILETGGVWHFEQSYLPTMVETLSYDTICHEHLLYFKLTDIKRILDIVGFKIIEVELNSINGGSIAVTAQKGAEDSEIDPYVAFLLRKEAKEGYLDGTALQVFARSAEQHKSDLKEILTNYKNQGYKVLGLGASTKGNVLLQWCGLDAGDITEIGDINPRKFGKETPGSCIPITSEENALLNPDSQTICIVLPWHFRNVITENAQTFLNAGGKLLFPLPNIEVI